MEDYKIYLINEGEEIKLGSIYSDTTHSFLLLDYAINNFEDNDIFKKLNITHSPLTISYFYLLRGCSLFLNTSKNKNKYGKEGILFLPNKIDDISLNKLNNIISDFKDYNLNVFYNLKLEDGIVDGDFMEFNHCNNIQDFIADFYNKENKRVKH